MSDCFIRVGKCLLEYLDLLFWFYASSVSKRILHCTASKIYELPPTINYSRNYSGIFRGSLLTDSKGWCPLNISIVILAGDFCKEIIMENKIQANEKLYATKENV